MALTTNAKNTLISMSAGARSLAFEMHSCCRIWKILSLAASVPEMERMFAMKLYRLVELLARIVFSLVSHPFYTLSIVHTCRHANEGTLNPTCSSSKALLQQPRNSKPQSLVDMNTSALPSSHSRLISATSCGLRCRMFASHFASHSSPATPTAS